MFFKWIFLLTEVVGPIRKLSSIATAIPLVSDNNHSNWSGGKSIIDSDGDT